MIHSWNFCLAQLSDFLTRNLIYKLHICTGYLIKIIKIPNSQVIPIVNHLKNHSKMATSKSEENKNDKKFDANRYATKKTIAQGMLDVALLTSNASHLKSVLQNDNHPFFGLSVFLICISMLLQVRVFHLFCTFLGNEIFLIDFQTF